jgi:4-hydroxybenzoate polyprenyltransferase
VFGDPFQPLPLTMGCIAALFLFGGTATKDILDAAADQKVGIKTLVNVFGLQKAAVLSMVFMTSAFLLVVPLIWLNIIDVSFLPLVFFTVLSLVIGWFMIHAHENESCENTSAWTLMYATYFLFAISFTTIIIAVSF